MFLWIIVHVGESYILTDNSYLFVKINVHFVVIYAYFLVEKISAKILFGENNDKYEVRVTVVTVEDPGEMFHHVTFFAPTEH